MLAGASARACVRERACVRVRACVYACVRERA